MRRSPPAARPAWAPTRRRLPLLAVPGVAFAAALCTLCFFGDGALQAYSALLLRDVQAAGPLAAGAALAAFHAASLAGRLGFARVLEGTGERALLIAAGGLAAAAMSVV